MASQEATSLTFLNLKVAHWLRFDGDDALTNAPAAKVDYFEDVYEAAAAAGGANVASYFSHKLKPLS